VNESTARALSALMLAGLGVQPETNTRCRVFVSDPDHLTARLDALVMRVESMPCRIAVREQWQGDFSRTGWPG